MCLGAARSASGVLVSAGTRAALGNLGDPGATGVEPGGDRGQSRQKCLWAWELSGLRERHTPYGRTEGTGQHSEGWWGWALSQNYGPVGDAHWMGMRAPWSVLAFVTLVWDDLGPWKVLSIKEICSDFDLIRIIVV